jgi:hypothetical protein
VDYRPRIGRSKVSGTVSGSVRAGLRILGLILRHARGRATGASSPAPGETDCRPSLER